MPWPTRDTTRALCKPTLVTGIFSTLSGTQNCRQLGSRTFGADRRRDYDREAIWLFTADAPLLLFLITAESATQLQAVENPMNTHHTKTGPSSARWVIEGYNSMVRTFVTVLPGN